MEKKKVFPIVSQSEPVCIHQTFTTHFSEEMLTMKDIEFTPLQEHSHHVKREKWCGQCKVKKRQPAKRRRCCQKNNDCQATRKCFQARGPDGLLYTSHGGKAICLFNDQTP